MPAPSTYEYHVDALVDAHQAVLDLIDGGSSTGFVRLYTDADAILAEIPLNDPAGTINATTGQLTITSSGPDTSANATGTCTWGAITDSDGTEIISLPATAGTSAVSGQLVLNSLSVVSGAEVTLVSATVG